MAKAKNMIDVGSLVSMIAKNRNWRQRLRLHQVFLFWEEVVGKDIACYAQPYVIRGEVLWVNVTDSIWMQQLHFQKCTLLAALNRRLAATREGGANGEVDGGEEGEVGLADLRFRMEAKLTMPVAPQRLERPRVIPPDRQRVQEFSQMLAAIGDEELKAAMQRCWLKLAGVRR